MAENKHEVKIVVNGKDAGAVSLLTRLKSLLDGGIIGALKGVRQAIGGVMSAFGVIGLAINGVNMLVDSYKKVSEWMHRAETAAKELREEIARSRYAESVSRAAESYKRLNREIAEALRLEKERKYIADVRKSRERDIEDADAERRKQLEISRLDPNADDYAEKRNKIERRYQTEESDRTAKRAREDVASRSDELYRQAKAKDAEEAELGKQHRGAVNNARRAYELYVNEIDKANASGEDTRKSESVAKAAAEYNKAEEYARKIKEEMIAAAREAQSIRNRASELVGENVSANIRNEANRQRIENEAKAEEADRRKREEERAKAEKKAAADRQKAEDARQLQLDQKAEDSKLARQKQEDLAALDPNDPRYEENRREIERTYEMRAAQDKRDRAKAAEERAIAEAEEEVRAAEKRLADAKADAAAKPVDAMVSIASGRKDKSSSDAIGTIASTEKRNGDEKRKDKSSSDAMETIASTEKRNGDEKRVGASVPLARAEDDLKAAQDRRDRAMSRAESRAAEEELNAIAIRQDRERRDEELARRRKYGESAFVQIDSPVPQNRLTAMGLGSGSTVDRTAREQANNVKTLVQLFREQISISRQSNRAKASTFSP